MKKLAIFIVAVLFAIVPLTNVSVAQAQPVVSATNAIAASEIDELTQEICNTLADRTSFTQACEIAAETIRGKFDSSSGGGGIAAIAQTSDNFLSNENLTVEVDEFTINVNVAQGLTYVQKQLTSYNVIAKVKNFDENKKTVLITTNFANHYSTNDAYSGVNAAGALGTAATTALTIKLANYLASRSATNEYNYVFAFFSATDEGNFGSKRYVEKYLSSDVMLVINLERLGCGETYFYTDESKTAHGEYIKEFSSSYSISEFPLAGRVLLQMETVDGLSYSHYAMRGDVSRFLSAEKACLELIGGKFNSLADNEGADEYVTNTSADTYENLVKNHPDYASKLSDVAQFVIELTSKSELKSVCVGAATAYKAYTKSWIAYVICLAILVILIVVLLIVTQKLEKTYQPPSPKKIKIAVFGREYEDFNKDEIVVDLQREKNNDVNPFDV